MNGYDLINENFYLNQMDGGQGDQKNKPNPFFCLHLELLAQKRVVCDVLFVNN